MRRAAVPVGVALAVGAAVAQGVPPHWRAAGLPSVLGYAKNVEHAAVTAALLAAAVSVWLLHSNRGTRVLTGLAVIGFAVVAASADPRALLGAAPQLAFTLLLFCALRLSGTGAGDGRGPRRVAPAERDVPRFAALVALGGLALGAFVLSLQPLEIDVFHHGEVLASAVDLLRGGRPFETFLWPHGLHDTGLTALWILATGKLGTSPIALAKATCQALGVVTAFVLGWRILGSRTAALAASGGLLAALVLHGGAIPGPDATLDQLGVLVFVALGFAALLAPRSELWAGACVGLAYLFRVETGVYAALVSLAVLAHRNLWEDRASLSDALRRLASSLFRFLAGAGTTLLVFHLMFGWPGPAWFTYTLLELPRYHRDSSGLPFPWPLRGMASDVGRSEVGMGLGALVFTLLLVIEAAHRRRSSLWFMALFAAFAIRSTLDRSDGRHLLQWTALPVLAAILLSVAGLRQRFGWSRLRTASLLFLCLALLDIGRLTLLPPAHLGGWRASETDTGPWALFLEHLRPNPTVGACAETFFTPSEARRETNRRFIDATCEVEALLRDRHVTELAIEHSASWYYVRFELPLPTRYFALARAYTPERQRALIHDLRAHRPQALLRARGFAALERLDVPDAVRVPLVDAYLRERRRDVAPQQTSLGDLYFWNEAAATPAPASIEDATASGVRIAVDQVLYQPGSGLFFAEGWAAAVSRPQPLLSLAPVPGAQGAAEGWSLLEYGRPRPDLAEGCGPLGHAACGFEYTAFIAPETLAAAQERGFIDLTAVSVEGARSRVELPLAEMRIMGALSDREWRGLGAAVAEAAAWGAADRRRALGIPETQVTPP